MKHARTAIAHVLPPMLTALLISFALSALVGCSPASGVPSHSGRNAMPTLEASDIAAQEEDWETTLGFTGDVCLADNYIPMQHLAQLGSTSLSDGISPDYLSLMRGEDILWVNNEFVFCDEGDPLNGKAWTFKARTANVSYLSDMGADIVGIANNHVFDYGEGSFEDTLNTLRKANIPYVGGGWNKEEAYAPVYMKQDDLTVAYVAASRAEYTIYTLEAEDNKPGIAWCYDNSRFLDTIREARQHADFVVALPHWGTEHSTVLEDAQIKSAHDYIDAGADAVIGTHPHILQGLEYYKGKPICYSLGNFWFDDYDIDTVLAELRISGHGLKGEVRDVARAKVELKLYPGVQSGAYTRLVSSDDEKRRIFSHLEGISPQEIHIDGKGIVSSPQISHDR